MNADQLDDQLDDQLADLHAQVKAGTVTHKLLRAFLSDPRCVLHGAIFNKFGKVKVNYGLTVVQMIALGKYDRENEKITDLHFTHDNTLGEVWVELQYVHYNRHMTTAAVLANLEARDLRPATVEELLAFGATFPNEQCKFPVIALGSVCTDRYGDQCVGCLDRYGSERGLYLSRVGNVWHEFSRFLAVSK